MPDGIPPPTVAPAATTSPGAGPPATVATPATVPAPAAPVARRSPLTGYQRDEGGLHPPLLHPPYRSTIPRAPSRPPVLLPHTLTELTGPLLGEGRVTAADADLTTGFGGGEALGQRIVLHGRVLDGQGRPVPNTLVEIWQANAAGRYLHKWDRHDAPLDPNFAGVGRALTDQQGRFRFVTVKPGAYPWGNHPNAWRPAHIHFSVFGHAFTQRLVTQMYFPDDPLFAYDPIFNSVPDPAARARLVSRFDLAATVQGWALGFAFDIVLRGPQATPLETPQ